MDATRPATAEDWNQNHPVGTPVRAYPGTRTAEPTLTRTRSRAWTLGHGAAVVAVAGQAGGILLSHVDAITLPEHITLRGGAGTGPASWNCAPCNWSGTWFGEDDNLAQAAVEAEEHARHYHQGGAR